MGMRKLIPFILGIASAYAVCSLIATAIFALWVFIADWLRNDIGFSFFRTVLIMGMVSAWLAVLKAMPSIQKAADEVVSKD